MIIVSALLALVLSFPAGGTTPQASYSHYLTGTVIDDLGMPLSGVNITAENTTNAIFSTFTDPFGHYNLSLPSGSYNMTAALVNFSADNRHSEIVIALENLTGINFTMHEILGRITGFVTSGTDVVAGAMVTVSSETRNYTSNSTLPLGQYVIERVLPDYYVARAEKKGYNASIKLQPVFIPRGETLQLNFSLDAQTAQLFGSVTVGGVAEEGVNVELRLNGAVLKETVTDANGNYSLANIPIGDYLVQFSKEGLEPKEVPTSFAPYEKKPLYVSMDRMPVEGGQGFIGNLDLTHSLMVVGLIVSFIVVLFALFIRFRAQKRPEILAIEEEEEPEEEEKKAKKK